MLGIFKRKEVRDMDNKPAEKGAKRIAPVPPRMTSAEIRARGKIRVSVTRDELEHLARLIRAGQVWLNDRQPLSQNLRAAMTKLGVDNRGL